MSDYRDAGYTPVIPDAEYNTNKQPYSPTGSFRFWAQRVLPTVYDDSLSYYEILTKVVSYLNNVIQNVDSLNDSLDNTNTAFAGLQGYVNSTKDALISAYDDLQGYVNHYFDNLDVQEEINHKLDEMAYAGTLGELVTPYLADIVADWMEEHITPTTPVIDDTLTISGAAADAKVAGDLIRGLQPFNAFDVLSGNLAETSQTVAGIVYTFAGDYWTASGTATGTSVKVLTPDPISIPDGMETGKPYPVKFKTSDVDVRLRFLLYDSDNTVIGSVFFDGDGYITLPDDVETLSIGYVVLSGTALSGTVTMSIPAWLTAKTNADLDADITADVAALENRIFDITANLEIDFVDGAYINLSGSTADITDPTASDTYRYAVVSCAPGDVFTIKGQGGISARLWGFVALSGDVISVSGTDITYSDYTEITAPIGSAYLVINDKGDGISYIGRLLDSRVDGLEAITIHDISTDALWENGGLTAASGAIAPNVKRIRTKAFANTAQEIKCTNNTHFMIFCYELDSGQYKGIWNGSGFQTSGYWFNYQVPTNIKNAGRCSIRLLGAFYPEATITYTDGTNFEIICSTDPTLSLYDVAADAGAAGQAIYTRTNINENMVLISHRGTRLTRPDSTSCAYINAKKCGFRYAEGDLQRTSDGHYVIGHDDNIAGRTGIDANISDMTLAQLKAIDFGGYLFSQYAGQAILTLEEFLQLCNNLGMQPVLDFKTKTATQVAEIFDIIDQYGVPIYNINGDMDTVKRVLYVKRNQFVRRSYTAYSATVETELASILTDYPNAHLMVAYDISSNTWTDAVLESIIARGIELCPYEINTYAQYEALMTAGRYYIHNFMGGTEFNCIDYALLRDNNITVS